MIFKDFEIIFCSSDRGTDAFREYYGTMPWLAIPSGDPRKETLSRMFDVEGIPTFVLIDAETGKTIDFWLVRQPAFLTAPELADLAAPVPVPAAAVISTDPTFITFLKLRLEYVQMGQFDAPSTSIPDALASSQ